MLGHIGHLGVDVLLAQITMVTMFFVVMFCMESTRPYYKIALVLLPVSIIVGATSLAVFGLDGCSSYTGLLFIGSLLLAFGSYEIISSVRTIDAAMNSLRDAGHIQVIADDIAAQLAQQAAAQAITE